MKAACVPATGIAPRTRVHCPNTKSLALDRMLPSRKLWARLMHTGIPGVFGNMFQTVGGLVAHRDFLSACQ